MNILGIIPAREKSKSIKNKNIIDLGGKPLISWTIEAALKSKLDKVIVSTDSRDISDISKEYGAEVPFIRPKKLATSNSHTIDVIIHSLENVDYKPTAIMLLQPTSPFRNTNHINESIKIFKRNATNSCISLCKVEFPPEWSISLGKKEINFPFWNKIESPFDLERQQLPIYYKPNGAIYISRVNYISIIKNLIDVSNCCYYIMDNKSSLDIDTEIDYQIAKEMIK